MIDLAYSLKFFSKIEINKDIKVPPEFVNPCTTPIKEKVILILLFFIL